MFCIKGSILILLNLYVSTLGENWRPILLSAKMFPKRLLDLMRNYVARSKSKIEDIFYIRGMYEVSPQFEYGYVMAEIIERYRKMVGTTQRPVKFKSDAVFDTIKRTELVQKLFFDILHLVYMANEIPRKYNQNVTVSLEFREVNMNKKVSMATIEADKKYREWVKKKQQKEMKKKTAMMQKGMVQLAPKKVPRRNKWWPIDYGWEIDYQWF